MWFEYFDSMDRNKLWNRLVFSETYFNSLANTDKFQREDIKQMMNRISTKVKVEIKKQKIKVKKQKMDNYNPDKLESFDDAEPEPLPKFQIILEEKEERRIRDLYFNNKVMMFVWS